jgi:hypothetical protein
MRLNDLENKNYANAALKENFEVDFDVSTLDKSKTRTMLSKVSGLIKESRQASDFYKNQNNPAYMKLVFMEQALADHFKYLSSLPKPRIVVENEEVEKSQVILAAQDMVDSVQKMYEEVNDMLVKELPALVDSIQSEIGVNESEQFNTQASEALTTLNASLQQAKTTLQSALGGVTGQGGAAFGAMDAEPVAPEGDVEVDAEVDADVTAELPTAEPAAPEEEPEADLSGGVGRAKR